MHFIFLGRRPAEPARKASELENLSILFRCGIGPQHRHKKGMLA
jgi:hypothetical protein